MAFSFRAGTNWCHDFPKLARESGFYFNMHRTRIRVDWNRICSLNIDQVIQESDFQTVDDNVNNVIDYSLEHEYDVKILDPNFVKLFRLAQLAVEYLLYCKQYLDQSVVILKDELKLKIEENVKLKKEVACMAECIKELKERSKSIDLRLSPQGEVHKCPYCPKSFISAMYVNAHINRRHSTSSPVPDDYKNETEKLHNEIKTLKERVNQTEKLVNESNKWTDSGSAIEKTKEVIVKIDKAENTEETSFGTTNFETEKLTKSSEEINKCVEDTNAALISELKLRMENDMESVQAKLVAQENYWKTKMETLESQHHQDIENLFSQLKVTQQAATKMKSEYESKIKDLERQSLNQSEMINAQTEMLHNLSQGIQDCKISQMKHERSKELDVSSKQNGLTVVAPAKTNKHVAKNQLSEDTIDSIYESSSEMSSETAKRKPQVTASSRKSEEVKVKSKLNSKWTEEEDKAKIKNKRSELIDEFVRRTKTAPPPTKKGKGEERHDSESKESCSEEQTVESYSDSEESESNSETKTESDESETTTNSTDCKDSKEYRKRSESKKEFFNGRNNSSVPDDLKEDMREIFNRKMQNLGIDPDWEGIPKATFKQKSNILKHHQNINAKKYPKYTNIRERLLLELSKKMNSKCNETKKLETPKQGLLSKVKMRALKAFNIQKSETKSPVLQKQVTHSRGPDQKPLFGAMRTRKMSLNEADNLRKTLDKEFSLRASDSRLNRHSEDSQSPETPPKTHKHESYETIEDFLRGTKKIEASGVKATSTPMKNVKSVVQQSYEDESDNISMSSEVLPTPSMSPKSSKSVLKRHPNSGGGSLVKKKVEFNLDDKRSLSEPTRISSLGQDKKIEVNKQRNLIESDVNISSFSEEELSPKKVEEVIVANRRASSLISSSVVELENMEKLSTKSMKNVFEVAEVKHKTPQAAPRNLNKNTFRTSVPENVSNFEEDIEEILRIS